MATRLETAIARIIAEGKVRTYEKHVWSPRRHGLAPPRPASCAEGGKDSTLDVARAIAELRQFVTKENEDRQPKMRIVGNEFTGPATFMSLAKAFEAIPARKQKYPLLRGPPFWPATTLRLPCLLIIPGSGQRDMISYRYTLRQ